jgi:hypothetical protein
LEAPTPVEGAEPPWHGGVFAQSRKFDIIGNFKKNIRLKERRWIPVEDAGISSKYRPTDSKLSKALGRSVQAIQQQRYLLLRD